MAEVTVKLLEPKLGGELREVVLRPPTFADYQRLGEPVTVVQRGDSLFTVENDATISAYLNVCVVAPEFKGHLAHLDLADAMQVREALLGFFFKARERLRPTAPTSSLSTSESPASATSAA